MTGLCTRHRYSAEEAARAAAAVLDVMKRELLSGQKLVLRDFAAMKIVERKAQIVKDPETGHQFISPAENVVSFTPIEGFEREIRSAKLSSIILVAAAGDPFARVTQFHFSRVGWRVFVVDSAESCVARLRDGAAHLVIVDHALPFAPKLLEEVRCRKETARVPLVCLYPRELDPARSPTFQVTPDEHLVEPFEVYTLLMLAESELARSSEEEALFDRDVRFQLGATQANLERAHELLERLLADSGMVAESQELLKAAFREALGNAVQHGNRDDAAKLVRVQMLVDREKVSLAVTDEGAGFDHEGHLRRAETRDAVSAARERHDQGRGGGLGIMLMRKCADRVDFTDGGRTITLTKMLRPAAVVATAEPAKAAAPAPAPLAWALPPRPTSSSPSG